MSTIDPLQKLLDFLEELDTRHSHYDLIRSRQDAIMAKIVVSGWRWEAEFFPDGRLEVEIFRTEGTVLSGAEAEEALVRLLQEDDDAERATGRRLPWEQ